MTPDEFQKMRREYTQQAFDEKDANTNPFKQFEAWFSAAQSKAIDMPNAMTLATASASGEPSARIVLLKDFNEQGFVFFTNYGSKKSQDLEKNPKASLLFHWSIFDRQIRIKGKVERVSKKISESYFKSRPIDSQISASISAQSHEVENRQALENAFAQKKKEIAAGSELHVPENWGGYCLNPEYFEFWQGRENRLHDRLIYERLDTMWKIKRLAP